MREGGEIEVTPRLLAYVTTLTKKGPSSYWEREYWGGTGPKSQGFGEMLTFEDVKHGWPWDIQFQKWSMDPEVRERSCLGIQIYEMMTYRLLSKSLVAQKNEQSEKNQ